MISDGPAGLDNFSPEHEGIKAIAMPANINVAVFFMVMGLVFESSMIRSHINLGDTKISIFLFTSTLLRLIFLKKRVESTSISQLIANFAQPKIPERICVPVNFFLSIPLTHTL